MKLEMLTNCPVSVHPDHRVFTQDVRLQAEQCCGGLSCVREIRDWAARKRMLKKLLKEKYGVRDVLGQDEDKVK